MPEGDTIAWSANRIRPILAGQIPDEIFSPRNPDWPRRLAGQRIAHVDTLELLTDGRRRFDQRLAALVPDVLAEAFDAERFLTRLRADDQTRTLGDALLDQRNVAARATARSPSWLA